MVTPLYAGYDSNMKSPFEFPEDSKCNQTNNKLLISAHIHISYEFTMRPDGDDNKFTLYYGAELYEKFPTFYNKFVDNYYHIVIGEMDAINKNKIQS